MDTRRVQMSEFGEWRRAGQSCRRTHCATSPKFPAIVMLYENCVGLRMSTKDDIKVTSCVIGRLNDEICKCNAAIITTPTAVKQTVTST